MARVRMRVGDYELKGVIGDGATGAVYRGRQISTDKQVAIKVLHSRRQDVVDQLVRGAKEASHVHHANLVDVTDVGTARDGTVFLTMELLEGESLKERLHRVGHLPLFEAINIVRQVAHGLGAAHAAGIVHGGLDPANIFLCRREGRRRIVRRSKAMGMRLVVEPEESFDLVKLLDLGLTRFLDLASDQASVGDTLRYRSPEQAQRRPVESHSDIYSLGAVFYEMVTGTVPFDGESLAEVLRQHVSGLVTMPSRRAPTAGIDSRIDALILRCLKRTPSLRFANTDELCKALDDCVTDCAFLRDAHRLPGIKESGIDLSEATSGARQNPGQPGETAAQVSIAPKHKIAPFAVKSVPPRVPPKPSAVPPAQVAAKPPTISSTDQPVPTRSATKRSPSAVAEKPPVRAWAAAPMADDPAAAMVTPPSAPVATVDQPALAKTVTPPPITLTSDLLTEIFDEPAVVEPETTTSDVKHPVASTGATEVVAPETSTSDVTGRSERDELEDDLLHSMLESWRRPKVMALAGVLLLGTLGLAMWAVRGGSATNSTAPVAPSAPSASPAVPPPSPPLPPLPPSPAPQAPAAAELAPASETPPLHVAASETPPVQALVSAPTPLAPAPAEHTPASESPPVQAAAPKPVTKAPAPAEPARASKATPVRVVAPAGAPAEPSPASDKPHPLPTAARAAVPIAPTPTVATPISVAPRQVAAAPADIPPRLAGAWANVPRNAPVPAPSPTAPKPAAKSTVRSEPAASRGTAQPAPTNVDQLVREAQQAWLGGQHAVAAGRAQAALKASPKPAQAMQAYEVIATCSCALRKRDTALAAASHLTTSRRELVKAVCAKNGVPFE